VAELPALDFLPKAVGPAVLIALISSVYTLMWSLIADTFTGSRHNPDRELFGLGLGNLAAGIVGVLLGSGTIATMTARRFGGKTVVAGIVCLVIVAALIVFLRTSKRGQAMRAVAQDYDAARLLGINTRRIAMLGMFIGVGLAGVAGARGQVLPRRRS